MGCHNADNARFNMHFEAAKQPDIGQASDMGGGSNRGTSPTTPPIWPNRGVKRGSYRDASPPASVAKLLIATLPSSFSHRFITDARK